MNDPATTSRLWAMIQATDTAAQIQAFVSLRWKQEFIEK